MNHHQIISGKNSVAAWKNAIAYVKEHGDSYIDRVNRHCIECLNLLIVIENTKNIDEPIQLLSRNDSWLYPNLHDVAKIMLPEFDSNLYQYSYGKRLFSYDGVVNQIDDFVIPKLRKNSYSRKAISVIAQPAQDSKHASSTTPSIIALDFKIRNDLLHVTCMIRSCDLFFGFPANSYQVHTIQEYVAKKLRIQNGSISFFCNSAHIFTEYDSILKKVFSYRT